MIRPKAFRGCKQHCIPVAVTRIPRSGALRAIQIRRRRYWRGRVIMMPGFIYAPHIPEIFRT